MSASDPRLEELNDEDRAYQGSRCRDIVEALFANPYQRVWGDRGDPLPRRALTFTIELTDEATPRVPRQRSAPGGTIATIRRPRRVSAEEKCGRRWRST